MSEPTEQLTDAMRANMVRESLLFYERQRYQARINAAAAIASPTERADAEATIAKCDAGIAEIRRVFAAELATPALPTPPAEG